MCFKGGGCLVISCSLNRHPYFFYKSYAQPIIIKEFLYSTFLSYLVENLDFMPSLFASRLKINRIN